MLLDETEDVDDETEDIDLDLIDDEPDDDDSAAFLPTPEEIRETCLAIQSTWDDDTRLRRARGNQPAVPSVPKRVPTVETVSPTEWSKFVNCAERCRDRA